MRVVQSFLLDEVGKMGSYVRDERVRTEEDKG